LLKVCKERDCPTRARPDHFSRSLRSGWKIVVEDGEFLAKLVEVPALTFRRPAS
jgi:hypothetical protein